MYITNIKVGNKKPSKKVGTVLDIFLIIKEAIHSKVKVIFQLLTMTVWSEMGVLHIPQGWMYCEITQDG